MTILIHPGFHKTGTTWLQNELFSDARLFTSLLDASAIDTLIVRPNDFFFDPDQPRRLIAEKAAARAPNTIPVLSSEILVGNPIFGARDGYLLAERLARIVPDARILLTVRAQPPILRAIYQQYVKRGGSLKPRAFFTAQPEPGYFGFHPDAIRFDAYADRYAALFGKANVLVLPQELLAGNVRQFVDLLVRFVTGATPPPDFTPSANRGAGKSPPLGGTPVFRIANHFRKTPIQPAGIGGLALVGHSLYWLGYRQHFFSNHYRREIDAAIPPEWFAQFAATNAALATYCPCDLEQLGYPMPR